LLLLAFVALGAGIAGGLARLTPLPVSIIALALHGPLMVSGFFGTLISLERAAALQRLWAHAAPLCAGLAGVLVVAGFPREGFAAMVLAALLLLVAAFVLLRRQPSMEIATLLAGAVAWLMGNLGLLLGYPAVPWWIAFFALTIGGERLELSRQIEHAPWARNTFMALAAALLFAPLEPPLLGVALVVLALWLFAFDIARVTVRQAKLPRYVALCLLAGYFWLALGGALIALEWAYDAALHAVFVGFVFSMVFGHAPVILPAVLRTPLPYHPVLYVPLALLHASLAVRVALSTPIGGWGNAAAIALFILCAAALALKGRNQGQSPNS
jgi:hypothetical protein